ncbi:MAG: hypothetical protein AAF696_37330 [Bacteroidota bacterium]
MSIRTYILKLLFFQISREELFQLNSKHLIVGLIGTWIVGMGRYWDDPGAHILQHLGLGSVIYIFGLSLLIWLVIKPYFVEKWTYMKVLSFVSLTSFPAIFYAIPVEMIFSMETSASINAWFLAIVAAWRLGLLYFFLRRFTGLGQGYILLGTLLPVCAIIAILTALNLERAVFNIMGGIRENSSKDTAYFILVALTFLSSFAVGPLLLGYFYAIFRRWKKVKKKD